MLKLLAFSLVMMLSQASYSQFSEFNRVLPDYLYLSQLIVFDADDDGDNDIINAAPDVGIGWYENLGDDGFANYSLISAEVLVPSDLMTMDFDQDGDDDLIYTSKVDGTVEVLENLGEGQFAPAQVLAEGFFDPTRIGKIQISDMEHLLVADDETDEILLVENLGNGTFGDATIIIENVPRSTNIEVGDIDGDNDKDILCASFIDGTVMWAANEGELSFGNPVILQDDELEICDVDLADLDDDGDLEIISSREWDGEISIFENLGGGNFGLQIPITNTFFGAVSIDVLDMDGDLDLDIVGVSHYTDKVFWKENDDGEFDFSEEVISDNDRANRVFSGDLNSDELSDIIIAEGPSLKWFRNADEGEFFDAVQLSRVIDKPEQVATADLDLDGDLDFVTVSSGDQQVHWYEQMPGENFDTHHTITSNVENGSLIVTVDINNTGYPDILIGDVSAAAILWIENYGNGAFSAVEPLTFESLRPQSFITEDFNMDGLVDIACAATASSRVVWFENLGDGLFSSEQSISNDIQEATDVWAEDVDGDDDPDILTASGVDGKIAWHENLGDGTFGEQIFIAEDIPGVMEISTGDMDGDGDMDVVYGSSFNDGVTNDSRVGWVEKLEGTEFGLVYVVSFITDDFLEDVEAGDMDGDGDLDLVIATTWNTPLAWFENTGGFNYTEHSFPINVGLHQLKDLHLDDVDLDGDKDVFVCAFSNAVGWYENFNNNGCTDPEACNYGPDFVFDDGSCTYAPCYNLADTNNDGVINIEDLLDLLGNLGCIGPDCLGDANGDGIVNVLDLLILLGWFGTTYP